MQKIQIIVGSVTGTAEGVARFLQQKLSGPSLTAGRIAGQTEDRVKRRIDINLNAGIEDLQRDPEELLVFCTSNTGCGELPGNLLSLYLQLIDAPPNIAGRRYALINLGDSSFPTYGEAGEALHTALQDIGAVPIAEPLLIDASMERYPQKIALDWAQKILS